LLCSTHQNTTRPFPRVRSVQQLFLFVRDPDGEHLVETFVGVPGLSASARALTAVSVLLLWHARIILKMFPKSSPTGLQPLVDSVN
jgi:hypothetical protein